jgi:hypothetical protein
MLTLEFVVPNSPTEVEEGETIILPVTSIILRIKVVIPCCKKVLKPSKT